MTKHVKKYSLFFLFAFLAMLYFRLLSANSWDSFYLTDSFVWAFLLSVIAAFILDKLELKFPNKSITFIFGMGFVLSSLIAIAISVLLMLPFNPELLKFYYIREIGLLLLYVCMFCAAYAIYVSVLRIHMKEKTILEGQKIQDHLQIRVLEQQINPHFLFNNLSVLSALIDSESKEDARTFLNRLSRVYRYIITHKSEDFVLLEDEIEIARDYVYLLQTRFVDQFVFRFD